ncbi:hypothetical protein E2C01_038563 [Portunus trituberculatus]|uniref:Uncharacterized protein n=1 Tax=Portunus trituberculatus TaxID=210409 RepID=A0A5B7FIB8_PORTR|nr:hypothetical protein [Portunus trituberculatus]
MVSLCRSEAADRRGHGEMDVQAWRSPGCTKGVAGSTTCATVRFDMWGKETKYVAVDRKGVHRWAEAGVKGGRAPKFRISHHLPENVWPP